MTEREPGMTADEGTRTEDGLLLLENLAAVNACLQDYGCRLLKEQESGWHFDTSLPQAVREKMRTTAMRYAITPNVPEGSLYFYQPGKMTLARKLKYLRPFTREAVEIDLDGEPYTYFMTNDEQAFRQQLQKLKLVRPHEKHWKPNYALHKNVIDKMAELGAVYSLTFSNRRAIANRYYEGNIPYIAYPVEQQRLLRTAIWNIVIQQNDVATLAKLIKKEADLERIIVFAWTPLMTCAAHDAAKSAAYLIQLGANVNAANKDGLTALMVAATKGATETVRVLLDKGADTRLRSKNGWTAYVYALAFNHHGIAAMLSEKGGAQTDPDGRLAFHDKLGFFIARFTALGERKPSEIYKNLNGYLTRKTFSKLRSETTHPKKENVILLAIGMRLSADETDDLLMSAGYVLSPHDESDRIIRAFMQDRNYDICALDCALWNKTRTSLMPKRKQQPV